MRKTTRCPKCQHNHILFLTQVADRYDSGGADSNALKKGPLKFSSAWRIGLMPAPNAGIFTLRPMTAGVVQAYVCKACGYTELYTRDPGSIPVDGEIVQELVGPESEGPYR